MKIGNVLKNILLIGLILILIGIMYARFIKKDAIITVLGKAFLIVSTGSMEPTISSKEFIIISQEKTYCVGDIVTYEDSEGFLITHRIVQIEEPFFTARGDANNIADSKTNLSNIQGKVIFHSKILGFFVLYLLKPMIILYIMLIVITELRFLWKEEEKTDEIQE